ncbi:MAG: hypothetical protein ACE5EA_01570 [Nitrospirota bacterium]
MLTQEYIEDIKISGNGDIEKLLHPTQDSSVLSFVLNKLGRLPYNFNGHCLLTLIHHKSANIRLMAVKNIGKLSNSLQII